METVFSGYQPDLLTHVRKNRNRAQMQSVLHKKMKFCDKSLGYTKAESDVSIGRFFQPLLECLLSRTPHNAQKRHREYLDRAQMREINSGIAQLTL
jgi:hypothetical protein